MKTQKEKKDIRMTVRMTKSQQRIINDHAKKYNMDPSAALIDRACNCKNTKYYIYSSMYKSLVNVSDRINALYDFVARTDSDYISKAEIMPLIDNAKKGCDEAWKRQ